MWLKFEEVAQLGYTPQWIRQKVKTGEWESRETGEKSRNGKPIREVELDSLPEDLQLKWLQLNKPKTEDVESSLTTDCIDSETRLVEALGRYQPELRDAFLAEAMRLLNIVHRFDGVKIKRIKNILTGKHDFVREVFALCREAVCNDAEILKIEPKRAKMPSPYTLDGWSRKAATDGVLIFIRAKAQPSGKRDKRRAKMSKEAELWVERNFRTFPSSVHLYKKLEKEAAKNGWKIPSYSFFYRNYKNMSAVVKTLIFGSKKDYGSKLAPYVPRDVSDLEALQVLVGDHSVRDVSVVLPDGNLARPWLTLWLDMRTYLIWGWHLDVTPSSQTIGLAYANGCMKFGAQPTARPADDFYSYLYTDWGKDYRCLDLNGRTLTFKKAALIDGSLQIVTTQRRVGLMDELGLKHLLARPYNAKEKPVERVHKDISAWEENTFHDEYCGRDAKIKPQKWVDNWHRHQKLQKKFGRDVPLLIQESPFMDFDSYRENIEGWIDEHNATTHKRSVLGGRKVIPINELNAMYSKVHISEEAMAFLLLKAAKKKIGKNGVTMIVNGYQMQFLHPEMSEHKLEEVEIRYSDNDYSHVWVILPTTDRKQQRIVKAELINRSDLLNPNKATLATIAQRGKHEVNLAKDYSLLNQSIFRGETTIDRVAKEQEIEVEMPQEIEIRKTGTGGTIHQMTKFDAPKIVGSGHKQVSTEQVESAEIINIFRKPERARIKDEWED